LLSENSLAQPQITRLAAKLAAHNVPGDIVTVDQMGGMEDALQEHLIIVEGLKHRDPDLAEAAIRTHLIKFQTRIRAVL
jgi:DNA-binding FadR family transcriptional regulator